MNYFKTIEMRSKSELQKVSVTLDEVEGKIRDAENAIEKADDMQNQYITILGIFASIVLAFTGGIAFSTSLLENINSVSVYRLTFVAVGMAFVLINVIYILTRFIIVISKKEYGAEKYSEYIKKINIIIIVFAIIITVCWFFDIRHLAQIFQRWVY